MKLEKASAVLFQVAVLHGCLSHEDINAGIHGQSEQKGMLSPGRSGTGLYSKSLQRQTEKNGKSMTAYE